MVRFRFQVPQGLLGPDVLAGRHSWHSSAGHACNVCRTFLFVALHLGMRVLANLQRASCMHWGWPAVSFAAGLLMPACAAAARASTGPDLARPEVSGAL